MSMLLTLTCCVDPQPRVSHAWTRATAGQAGNAAVFMTIHSPEADRLLSASAEVARKTGLMTMVITGGTMSMRYVGRIDLPAGARVSLDPNGLHVWLEGLKQPLRAGQSFPLTVKFEKAGQRRVEVQIIPPSAPPPR